MGWKEQKKLMTRGHGTKPKSLNPLSKSNQCYSPDADDDDDGDDDSSPSPTNRSFFSIIYIYLT